MLIALLHYSTCLVLIYLITGNMYLLTAFNQLPLPQLLPLDKSDLFSYEFICFENIIDLQHYISFCYIQYFCTIQNDHHDKSSHHTKLPHNYWLYSSHCIFHTCNIICKFVALNLPYLFLSPTTLSPLTTSHLFVLCIYDYFAFVMLVSLFCFLESTCKWNHTVFVFKCLTYFT